MLLKKSNCKAIPMRIDSVHKGTRSKLLSNFVINQQVDYCEQRVIKLEIKQQLCYNVTVKEVGHFKNQTCYMELQSGPCEHQRQKSLQIVIERYQFNQTYDLVVLVLIEVQFARRLFYFFGIVIDIPNVLLIVVVCSFFIYFNFALDKTVK